MCIVDENSIAIRVQAALCAFAAGEELTADHHAKRAQEMHSILFGGGVKRFRLRYAMEMKLNLRPQRKQDKKTSGKVLKGVEALDSLWPLH